MLKKFGRAALYVPVAFLALISLFVGFGLLQFAVDRVRGYQLVTLKTKMYWENGKAVAGDKVKTWKLAVPNNIWLRQNSESWSIYTFRTPVYSNRREDFGSSRFVTTLTQLSPSEEIIPYSPKVAGPNFTLTFTNMIPFGSPGPKGDLETYYRLPTTSSNCVSQDTWIDYHGWIVRLSLSNLSPERKCAIVAGTLDRWTVHIDDLLSKGSGQ